MAKENTDTGMVTKITGMTLGQAMAMQLQIIAAKEDICPNAQGQTVIGSNHQINQVNMPKIDKK